MKIPTQNLLILLLLMLMIGLYWQQFVADLGAEDCSDFEHNVWSRFYFKVEIQILTFKFSRDADVCLKF